MCERRCLLLEDQALTSLSACLESMEWDIQLFDINVQDTSSAAAASTIGIIHHQRITPETLSKLRSILQEHPNIEWIFISDELSIQDDEVKAFICKNCRYYLTEKVDDPLAISALKVQLKTLMEQAFNMAKLRQNLPDCPCENTPQYRLLGKSGKMQELLTRIAKAARVDAPVLIIGESGTGKELAARTIHERSSRKDQSFVAINCGAIPETLIQSELFGYEKGAFTGATGRHAGKFEQAHMGTLFLDEIAELPLNLQVNLLRFLQEKTIERLGGAHPIKLNVRVIAATHENLENAVAAGRFREDLYYRLAVLQVETPPLRQRHEDLQSLANHFLETYASASGAKMRFCDTARAAIAAHPWPGNVRELMNRIQSAVIMSDDTVIRPNDLGLNPVSGAAQSNILSFSERKTLSLEATKQLAEISAIKQALKEYNHNISKASKKLEISRASMYRLMRKYELG